MCLLIGLYLFFAEYFTKFLGDNHQRFESFFDRFGDSLDEGIIREEIFWFGNVSSLEHLLPDLIRCHEKADADCLHRDILSFEADLPEFPFDILLHSFVELFDVGLAEGELSVPFILI